MSFIRPNCNCPDATQNADKNLFASSQSQTFDRNWDSRIASDGAVTPFPGIRDRGGYCIHELAVLNIRQEIDNAFPNGIPYEPKIDALPPRRRTAQKVESDSLYLAPVPEIDI